MLFRAISIYKKLTPCFPKSERKNLFAVCKLLARANRSVQKLAFGGVCVLPREKKWELLSGEFADLPERIYFRECSEAELARLTDAQKAIYPCIFFGSHDGFARERHIEALFALGVPDFALPYVVKSGGDYVREIVQTLYRLLGGEELERYRKFCRINIKNVQSCHSRMMSYWWEYYRGACPCYDDYVGKVLFAKCFGFRKTGQKYISVYNTE